MGGLIRPERRLKKSSLDKNPTSKESGQHNQRWKVKARSTPYTVGPPMPTKQYLFGASVAQPKAQSFQVGRRAKWLGAQSRKIKSFDALILCGAAIVQGPRARAQSYLITLRLLTEEQEWLLEVVKAQRMPREDCRNVA